MSRHSASCLAALLSVHKGTYQVNAVATPRALSGIDVRDDGYRVVLRSRVNNRPWKGYFDVFSLEQVSRWSLVGFFRTGSPQTAGSEQKALNAVGHGLPH